MDIGTHILTGTALSTVLPSPEAKIACIVGAIIPDITMLPIYGFLMQKHRTWRIIKFISNPQAPLPKSLTNIYHFCHSPLLFLLIFMIGILSENSIAYGFSLGYLSHILWDIPTHRGQWAHRPLFPFSQKKIEGYEDWWTSRWCWVISILWIILILITLLI